MTKPPAGGTVGGLRQSAMRMMWKRDDGGRQAHDRCARAVLEERHTPRKGPR